MRQDLGFSQQFEFLGHSHPYSLLTPLLYQLRRLVTAALYTHCDFGLGLK